MLRKVLFPTDFSKGSENAVERFDRENEMKIGELILLHVIDESILDELTDGFSMLYNSAEEELNAIKGRLKKAAKEKLSEISGKMKEVFKAEKVSTIVKFGIPYYEICKTATEENVSLILLPSHGKISYSKEIFGSTTLRVLKLTEKPALIIPAFQKEAVR